MTSVASTPAKPAQSPSQRIFNYSAGPGCLPEEVLRQAQADIWNIAGSGIGIMEHSHRARLFDRVLEVAVQDCRDAGSVPADFHVLFLTGGASWQNAMIPANLMPQSPNGTADYFNTGYWAQRSIDEGRFYGHIHEAASSKAAGYTYIPGPDQTRYSAAPAYVHFTSNNTIFGTQFRAGAEPTPPKGVPVTCDMCSDIFSRPIDYSKYDLIYAGAQKNLGCAGTTIVLIRDALLKRCNPKLPSLMSYCTFVGEGSRPNTPPVFPIYVSGLMFKWIKAFCGDEGLARMDRHNRDKAAIVYDVIDASGFYRGHARKDSRSLMNILFFTPNARLDEMFVTEAFAAGMDNLKGHRSSGGMRASLYNSMPTAGAEALAQFMREFERRHG